VLNPVFGHGTAKAMMEIATLSHTLRSLAARQNGNGVLNLPPDLFKQVMRNADPRVKPLFENAKAFG
jgi:hypothetical protein